MTDHELLTELRLKGVEIKASSEDRLVIDAPKGTITEELRAALTGNKADLLTILKAEQVQKGAEAVSHSEARSVRVPERSPVGEMESPATVAPSLPSVPASVSQPAVNAQPASAVCEVIARLEEEKRRQIADQEIARAEAEVARMREMEDARRREANEQIGAATQAHESNLASLRQAEEEQSHRRTEEERHYLETEARKRSQEEQ